MYVCSICVAGAHIKVRPIIIFARSSYNINNSQDSRACMLMKRIGSAEEKSLQYKFSWLQKSVSVSQ